MRRTGEVDPAAMCARAPIHATPSIGHPAFGRERRRQARIYLRWANAARAGARPTLADITACADLAGPAPGLLCSTAEGDALGRALARHAMPPRDAGPLEFRFVRAGIMQYGLLLPVVDGAWVCVAANEVFVGAENARSLGQSVAAALALGTHRAGGHASASDMMWSGAVAQPTRTPSSLSHEARLRAARTWAALAFEGPAVAIAMPAALAAALDILTDRAGSAAGVLTPLMVARSVFDTATRAMQADVARALAHGVRLGLDGKAFVRLIEERDGGWRAIVAAERAIRRSPALHLSDASPDDEEELIWWAVDHAQMERLGRATPFAATEARRLAA